MSRSQFNWLETELNAIKTNGFHIVEEQPLPDLTAYAKLPESYVEFLERFGAARLYKKHKRYRINILSSPVEKMVLDYGLFLQIGCYHSCPVYFSVDLLAQQDQGHYPIFELEDDGILDQVSDDFAEWLEMRASQIRKSYTPEEWKRILQGPEPFTQREQKIIDARHSFIWEVVEFNEKGEATIRVHNRSNETLPYLTIGVRIKNSTMESATRIDVSDLKPGEEKTVHKLIFPEEAKRNNLILEDLPDPTPEEREMYWEFRQLA